MTVLGKELQNNRRNNQNIMEYNTEGNLDNLSLEAINDKNGNQIATKLSKVNRNII